MKQYYEVNGSDITVSGIRLTMEDKLRKILDETKRVSGVIQLGMKINNPIYMYGWSGNYDSKGYWYSHLPIIKTVFWYSILSQGSQYWELRNRDQWVHIQKPVFFFCEYGKLIG